eukprot:717791-Prymnesium_polylepis.1
MLFAQSSRVPPFSHTRATPMSDEYVPPPKPRRSGVELPGAFHTYVDGDPLKYYPVVPDPVHPRVDGWWMDSCGDWGLTLFSSNERLNSVQGMTELMTSLPGAFAGTLDKLDKAHAEKVLPPDAALVHCAVCRGTDSYTPFL